LFFDEATIIVRAGRGGNGIVAFRREAHVPMGGPNGGNGGRGGNVYLRVDDQLNTLVPFARRRHFRAANGVHGSGSNRQGANGEDLYVDVPPGTVVRDQETGALLGDLTLPGEMLLVAQGGRGGRGNEAFKSSSRQAPRFAEKGEPGEERTLQLELKVIAEVGLLGKPNAGKSTLLAATSAARPKIADYPFTTLSPNLGVVEVDGRTLVLADIPGLIEGASGGAGLGLQFLRHVERTRLLIHLLDGAGTDPASDFRAINRELALYSARLAAKPQIVVVNKIDLPEARARLPEIERTLAEAGPIYAISGVTHEGVTELLRAVAARLAELPPDEPEAEEELYVFRPHQREESGAFEVTQEGPGVFRVSGQEIERLAVMTDWSTSESMERFERILVSRGISDALIKLGVELGDTVFIGTDIELEWR
jgi:GTP-binding protein